MGAKSTLHYYSQSDDHLIHLANILTSYLIYFHQYNMLKILCNKNPLKHCILARRMLHLVFPDNNQGFLGCLLYGLWTLIFSFWEILAHIWHIHIHIHIHTLYSLKTDCMSIFAYQAFKSTSKKLLTKQELGCLLKCSSKSSPSDMNKALK